MDDKRHFQEFLMLCQRDNVTVWADPDLMRTKGTTGHWNGDSHLSVHRPGGVILGVLPNSSTERVMSFVDQSPNPKLELAILLHEYGHWFHKHPHQSGVDSNTAYKHEIEAWDKGEEIGRDIGIKDFTVFHADREKALLGYRIGLKLDSSK